MTRDVHLGDVGRPEIALFRTGTRAERGQAAENSNQTGNGHGNRSENGQSALVPDGGLLFRRTR